MIDRTVSSGIFLQEDGIGEVGNDHRSYPFRTITIGLALLFGGSSEGTVSKVSFHRWDVRVSFGVVFSFSITKIILTVSLFFCTVGSEVMISTIWLSMITISSRPGFRPFRPIVWDSPIFLTEGITTAGFLRTTNRIEDKVPEKIH